MEVSNFLKLNDKEQKEYVVNLEVDDFNKFNALLKKKYFKLSMSLSSHRQSSKNMINKIKEESSAGNNTNNIDIYIILANPVQPRKQFSDADIKEKMDSIKQRGLITPITVYKDKKGDYVLIAGQLRLEAFKRLNKEEKIANTKSEDMIFNKIDVYVKNDENYSEDDFAIDSLSENIIRTDMNVIDTANSIKKVFDAQDKSLSDFSRDLGKSKFYLSSYLAIANTDPILIEYISKKEITTPTIIYLIIQMNKSAEEKIKIIDKYLNGEVKKADLVEMRREEGAVKERNVKNEENPLFERVFTFKKSFNMTKYRKMDDINKTLINKKLEEIEKLQQEISTFF